jgi:hypothetical protein
MKYWDDLVLRAEVALTEERLRVDSNRMKQFTEMGWVNTKNNDTARDSGGALQQAHEQK